MQVLVLMAAREATVLSRGTAASVHNLLPHKVTEVSVLSLSKATEASVLNLSRDTAVSVLNLNRNKAIAASVRNLNKVIAVRVLSLDTRRLAGHRAQRRRLPGRTLSEFLWMRLVVSCTMKWLCGTNNNSNSSSMRLRRTKHPRHRCSRSMHSL